MELVKTIGRWHQDRMLRMQIQLLPDESIQDIYPLLSHPDLRCTYRTAGWGVFLIRAKVIEKDGKETLLTHYLQLEYPEVTPTTA